ncbi:MAG: SMP-30/gluconolactonase/LRE family protein [Candidatus Latescibacteria bacterium]|nr:SMP-30/gluconolactonase/LRE family protein [Candidatus Latescibacterota bacterium]
MPKIGIYSLEGQKLAEINLPERPTNCTFGGPDMKVLYITARTTMYKVSINKTGHRFATHSQVLGVEKN